MGLPNDEPEASRTMQYGKHIGFHRSSKAALPGAHHTAPGYVDHEENCVQL